MTSLVEAVGKKDNSTDKAELMRVESLAAKWLYLGNVATASGKMELAERRYAKGQKWHDKMNRLLGRD